MSDPNKRHWRTIHGAAETGAWEEGLCGFPRFSLCQCPQSAEYILTFAPE